MGNHKSLQEAVAKWFLMVYNRYISKGHTTKDKTGSGSESRPCSGKSRERAAGGNGGTNGNLSCVAQAKKVSKEIQKAVAKSIPMVYSGNIRKGQRPQVKWTGKTTGNV